MSAMSACHQTREISLAKRVIVVLTIHQPQSNEICKLLLLISLLDADGIL